MEDKLDSLFKSFLDGTSSKEDRDALLSMLKASPENRQRFVRFYDDWEKENESEFDFQQGIKKIESNVIKVKMRRLSARVLSVAACVAIIIGICFAVFSDHLNDSRIRSYVSENEVSVEPFSTINPLLALSEDNKIEINRDSGVDIVYKDGKIYVNGKEQNIAGSIDKYNTLSIPYGTIGSLTLEDGTRIWANANSRIDFPSSFDSDKTREIFLQGQIYLEVTHDKSRPFIVRTDYSNVKVLGTKFQVSTNSGKSDEIDLLSGSVLVIPEKFFKKSILLKPNESCTIDSKGNGEAKKISDTEGITAWKDGLYISNNEPFTKLVSMMREYYGCQIVCSEEVEDLVCTGRLHLRSDLETMLSELSSFLPISVTRKNGNCYIITRKE